MSQLDTEAAMALLERQMGAVAEQAAAPVAALEAEPQPAADDPLISPEGYRYLRPLAEAADDFAAQARTLGTGQRIYTGIDVFDAAMRGLAPKELMLVQGYAHSGKTLFVTEMMRANHEARMVLFTADEDRVLVLTKLVSLVHGVPAEVLERRIADGDKEAERLVRSTAIDHFPDLVVFDNVSDIKRMSRALNECRDHWGEREQLCIFDYAGLLQGVGDGDGGNVVGKIDALKGWGKEHAVPMVLMHQSSRTKGSDGGEVTIDSGTHGGEQQATFVVGVRRQKNYWNGILRDLREKRATQMRTSEGLDDKIAEAEWELARHENTITFNLVKNKRPPGHLVGDTDFELDRDTGRISPVDMAFSRTSTVGGRSNGTRPSVTPRESFGPTTVTRPRLPMSDFSEDF